MFEKTGSTYGGWVFEYAIAFSLSQSDGIIVGSG
jgi:hypothetical protein